MDRFRSTRRLLLGPLLVRLDGLGLEADHVTIASLAAGLSFVPLWFVSPAAALAALGLHVALDAIDGPLARHQGRASTPGSVSDTLADQTVIAATTVTLMSDGTIGVIAGGAYVFVYTVVVGFALVRNALAIPYSWLVRPRLAVYAWIPLERWLLPGSLDALLWLCVSLLALKMLSGFVEIRRELGVRTDRRSAGSSRSRKAPLPPPPP